MSAIQKTSNLIAGLAIISFWFIKAVATVTFATLIQNRKVVLADPLSSNSSVIVNYN